MKQSQRRDHRTQKVFRRLPVYVVSLFAFSVLCTEAAPTWASENGQTPFGKGLLWQITSSSSVLPSYLFGTIHSEDPRVLELPSSVQQALYGSEGFCMEILLDITTMAYLTQRMLYTDGQNLQTVLGEELFAQVAPLMVAHGVPEQTLMVFKPWAAFMTLNMPKPQSGRFLDLMLYEIATQQGKTVCGLETPETQVGVFEKLSTEDQILLLRETVTNYPSLQRLFEQLTVLYLERDLAGLVALNEATSPTSPEAKQAFTTFLNHLLTDRNVQMVERMIPRLQEGKTFIAVGALHLPGQKGLLQLLQDRGYTVSVVY